VIRGAFGVAIYPGGGGQSGNPNFNPSLIEKLKRLPDVRRVAAGVEVTGAPLTADGSPRVNVIGVAYPVASVNGLLFNQDRLAVTMGRRASPNRRLGRADADCGGPAIRVAR
jgi:hypothetical protein